MSSKFAAAINFNNQHDSKLVAIAGHHDCAGNPVGKETQDRHTLAAIETVKTWDFKVDVTGLWVDENWEASEVK